MFTKIEDNIEQPPESPESNTPPTFGGIQISRQRWIALLIVGLVALAGLVLVIINITEISGFAVQVARAKPKWLGVAALSQLVTYGCVAIVWVRILNSMDYHISFFGLFPLAVAKMFSDQAIPSGGVAGAALLFHALGRRGVPYSSAFTVFTFAAVTFLVAFMAAAIISFFAIAITDSTDSTLLSRIAMFAAIIAFFIVIILLLFLFQVNIPHRLYKYNWVKKLSSWLEGAKTHITSHPGLFFEATAIQFSTRVLDGLTLMLVFLTMGSSAPYAACFFAVAIASVTATIAPIPMGLGTFEAGMIATLKVFGVPIEEALTATLMFRGLSLWLPLIPGFYIIQREILRQKASAL